jgi:hypothetical protein
VATTGYKHHRYGHVAIAVENYKAKKNFFTGKVSYKSDGTYTVYDLSATRESDLEGSQYHTEIMTKEQLDNSMDYNAQVEFKTDYKTDQEVNSALDAHREDNPDYKQENMCGDYVKPGIEVASGQTYEGTETLHVKSYGLESETTVITPNQTYKEVSKMKGATVLKDPGSAAEPKSLVVGGGFSDAAVTTSSDGGEDDQATSSD